jgi:hypothetical protein
LIRGSFGSFESSALFAGYGALDPWCVSPEFSAARALSITCVLRVLGLAEGRVALTLNANLAKYVAVGFSDNCNPVITFYATSLAEVVGPSFQAPSLAYLARHWFESTSQPSFEYSVYISILNAVSAAELRQAARILFDAGIARLSDEETIVLAEQWQHDRTNFVFIEFIILITSFPVPCLQPDAQKELIPAAMSLFLCGYLAAEKYSLLSTR